MITNGNNVEQPALASAPTASLQSGVSDLSPLHGRMALLTSANRSFVYVAYCAKTGLRKIGTSEHPVRRLKELNQGSRYLNTSNPLALNMVHVKADELVDLAEIPRRYE